MKTFKVTLELLDNVHMLPLDKIGPRFIKKLFRGQDITEILNVWSLTIKKIEVREKKK
jgi:hypothetical protein